MVLNIVSLQLPPWCDVLEPLLVVTISTTLNYGTGGLLAGSLTAEPAAYQHSQPRSMNVTLKLKKKMLWNF